MNNTRKNKIICYTGIAARKNAKHTRKNFGKITRKLYPTAKCKRMKNYKNKYGSGSECPKNGNINGWVNYFGAEYTTPKNCNSIVKNNKAIHNRLKPK
jgi:hypothetical protein